MEEIVFLNENEVMVSNARFVIRQSTYSMRALVSVELDRRQKRFPAAPTILGLLLTSIAMVLNTWEAHWITAVAILIGIIMVMAALLSWFAAKEAHLVRFTMSSGDQHTLADKNGDFIRKVFKALNDAIRQSA